MRKTTVIILILLSFSLLSFSFVFAEEAKGLKTEEVFQWVASKMKIQINPKIPLPQIKKVFSEKLLLELAVDVLIRDFENTLYLEDIKGKSKEELVKEIQDVLAQMRKKERHEFMDCGGFYDPYENTIYLVEGSGQWILAHEATHYFQVKYQRRYPEDEVFKNLSEEKQEEIEKEYDELENEAKRIEEEFREEFFPSKIEAFSRTKAPIK